MEQKECLFVSWRSIYQSTETYEAALNLVTLQLILCAISLPQVILSS